MSAVISTPRTMVYWRDCVESHIHGRLREETLTKMKLGDEQGALVNWGFGKTISIVVTDQAVRLRSACCKCLCEN